MTQTKLKTICLRVGADEYLGFGVMARKSGLSMSEWLRQVARAGAGMPARVQDELPPAIRAASPPSTAVDALKQVIASVEKGHKPVPGPVVDQNHDWGI